MLVEKAAIIDLNEDKKLAPISHCHQRHQDEIAISGKATISIDDYAVYPFFFTLATRVSIIEHHIDEDDHCP